MTDRRPAVIVTGSSGLIGRPVCRQLAEVGYQVYGFDRVGLPEPPKDLEFVRDIECDLSSSIAVKSALEKVHQLCEGRLASVVHMAAYYDFSGEDSDLYREVTVNGTDRLLNGLEDFQLEQFVFTSTMLVHQSCQVGQHLSEDDPLRAKWPYPQSKIDTERLIREGHPGVRSVMLRIAGVYTDYGRQPTLVQQIKRIYEKDLQGHFFPGDTEAGQSAVHVDDVVDAVVRTVERRDQIDPKTAILIGESDPPSYEELQQVIAQQLHGKEWATMHIPKPVAKVGAAVSDVVQGGDAFIKPFMVDMADDHYALNLDRAKALLGWQPRHHLMQTIPEMTQMLQSDPDRWYELNGLV
ncbi:NAD-dependent epimerase/dehydratase family protein [Roseiconus lacunae]|uniref:NAD(P)-dependent oxidoreductase n=1 Tax=Roseiconus lacunae TaxID=2605694 RepID=A0ABT7PJ50_9BACT|nr:NAD(P)-dependent oxidoreductase [Roseiconus lacunae]MCD0462916.1 NAD(P)-dependent oxidoreductase [Roseiconus lacunae]MDM4016518.1 NAD(P)-dependent oxidoreductase [Roseiconus lacunae]WRQ49389.1 NAD(P)-dependent oxidoreductase [Stieleria sp. HD01]